MRSRLARPAIGKDWVRSAAGLMVPREYNFRGARRSGLAAGAFSITSLTLTSSIFTLSSGASWTNANLGAVAGGGNTRTILVACGGIWLGTFDEPTGCTCNGVTMSLASNVNGGGNEAVALFYGEVPTGTTGVTISFTWASTPDDHGVAVWSCIANGSLALDTGQTVERQNSDMNNSLTVTGPGFIICTGQDRGAAGGWTWGGGLTEDFDGDVRTGDHFGGASELKASGGSSTITSNSAETNWSVLACVFEGA